MPAATRTRATLEAMDPGLAEEIRRTIDDASDLSAAARFAQWHETTEASALAPLYRELMPASPPGPGEQYAFEVDLDICSGCKACVAACHSQNGLDDGESWRVAGSLLGVGEAAHLTVTSSCHHCTDPGCASGCPTLAYEKDAKTGIVHHLDDQCMGCQYCLWTCPYDAPKWNERLGIVRKCDMCRGRLSAGEAPACVQSCPHQAIRIVKVSVAALEADPRSGTVLPGISPPEATRPSTIYKGQRPERARPADADDLVPEHAHTPLALLLVLTQWGTGLWLLATLRDLSFSTSTPVAYPLATLLVVGGLVVGAFHLGRPERAWKAFLGWRRSWFSREVLAFGNAVPLCLAAAIPASFLPESVIPAPAAPLLPWAALALLLAGATCSTMLYLVTPRPAWARPATALRFGLTLLGGGAVTLGALGGEGLRTIGAIAIATGLAKVWLVVRDRRPSPEAPEALRHQARLLAGPLRGQARLQRDLFFAALAAAMLGTALAWPSLFVVAALLRLGSDAVERTLFFRACPATRMPGGAGHA